MALVGSLRDQRSQQRRYALTKSASLAKKPALSGGMSAQISSAMRCRANRARFETWNAPFKSAGAGVMTTASAAATWKGCLKAGQPYRRYAIAIDAMDRSDQSVSG